MESICKSSLYEMVTIISMWAYDFESQVNCKIAWN